MSLCTLNIDILEQISSNLPWGSCVSLSMVSRDFKFCSKHGKRKYLLKNFLKISKIYNELLDIEENPEKYVDEFIWPESYYLSEIYDRWENTIGFKEARALELTTYDFLERNPPHKNYREVDPEIYDFLVDDMKMMAPTDLPVLCGFYLKVMDKVFRNGIVRSRSSGSSCEGDFS